MKSKAADTRGKLDDNKHLKKKGKPKEKKRNLNEFKEDAQKAFHKPKIKLEKKISKAEVFKKQHGYSLSIMRAMNRNGVVTLDAYKAIRKTKKKALKKLQQQKHAASTAFKRANRKSSNKGSQPKVAKKP